MARIDLALIVLRVCILLVIAYAVRTRNVPGVLNGVFAGVVSLAPLAVGFSRPATLWVSTVALVHAVGSTGWYREVWWWDHVAHTLAGALVAAIGYGAIVAAAGSAGTTVPPAFLQGFAVLFAVACGVLWELLEVAARDVGALFDLTPMLAPHGARDAIEDLLFDGIGAGVAVVVPVRLFVPLIGRLRVAHTTTLDVAFLGLLALVVGLGVGLGRIERARLSGEAPATTEPSDERVDG